VSDWAHFFIVNLFAQPPPLLEKIIQSARLAKSTDSLEMNGKNLSLKDFLNKTVVINFVLETLLSDFS
jgi:hypothetical protein